MNQTKKPQTQSSSSSAAQLRSCRGPAWMATTWGTSGASAPMGAGTCGSLNRRWRVGWRGGWWHTETWNCRFAANHRFPVCLMFACYLKRLDFRAWDEPALRPAAHFPGAMGDATLAQTMAFHRASKFSWSSGEMGGEFEDVFCLLSFFGWVFCWVPVKFFWRITFVFLLGVSFTPNWAVDGPVGRRHGGDRLIGSESTGALAWPFANKVMPSRRGDELETFEVSRGEEVGRRTRRRKTKRTTKFTFLFFLQIFF